MGTFTTGEDLRENRVLLHWSPIVKSGIEAKDKNRRDSGDARYTSTLKLLGWYMEISEDRV